MYVLVFPTKWPDTFLILTITETDIIIYVHRSASSVPAFSVLFLSIHNFIYRHSKNFQIPISIKIHPFYSHILTVDKRRDRQTDGHDGANSRFSKLANVSKKFLYERLWQCCVLTVTYVLV
jgi:hypothetical protein